MKQKYPRHHSSLWIALMCFLLPACGTVKTLGNSDSQIAGNLARSKSNCTSMPRVYSGVAYNLCKLNSESDSINVTLFLGAYLVDSMMSAATDTVALPYTLYAQGKRGNLVLDDARR